MPIPGSHHTGQDSGLGQPLHPTAACGLGPRPLPPSSTERPGASALCPRASCLGALCQLSVAGPACDSDLSCCQLNQGAGAVADAEKQRVRPLQGHSVLALTPCASLAPTCPAGQPVAATALSSPLFCREVGSPGHPESLQLPRTGRKRQEEWASKTPSSQRCFLTYNMCQTLLGTPWKCSVCETGPGVCPLTSSPPHSE